jgi:hypothetical protein
MENSSNEALKRDVSRLEEELEAMTASKHQQEVIAGQSSALTKSLMTQVEQLQEQLKEAQADRDKAKDDAVRLGGMRQMIEGQFAEVAEHCQLLIDEKNRLTEENERLLALTSPSTSASC